MNNNFLPIISFFHLLVARLFNDYQNGVSKHWSNCLATLIADGEVVNIDKYTIDFVCGGKTYGVWITNGWFGFGSLYSVDGKPIDREDQQMANIKTTWSLYKKIYLPLLQSVKKKKIDRLEELYRMYN